MIFFAFSAETFRSECGTYHLAPLWAGKWSITMQPSVGLVTTEVQPNLDAAIAWCMRRERLVEGERVGTSVRNMPERAVGRIAGEKIARALLGGA